MGPRVIVVEDSLLVREGVCRLSTYAADDLPADGASCGAAGYIRKDDLTPAMLRELLPAYGGVPPHRLIPPLERLLKTLYVACERPLKRE